MIDVFSSVDASYHRPFYRWLTSSGLSVNVHVWGAASEELKSIPGVNVIEQRLSRGYSYNDGVTRGGVSWREALSVLRCEGLVLIHGWAGIYWMLLIFLAILGRKKFFVLNDLNHLALHRQGLFGVARLLWLKFVLYFSSGVLSTSVSNQKLMRGIRSNVRIYSISWHAIYLRELCLSWVSRQAGADFANDSVLYVGRYESIKGFDLMPEVAQIAGVEIACHGYGSLAYLCTGALIERGRYTPVQLPQFVMPGSIVLAPSRSEALGLAVLEAAACGAVVILSDAIVAAREVLDDVEGFIYTPPSSEVIGAALSRVLKYPITERINLGDENRTRCRDWVQCKVIESGRELSRLLAENR